MKSRWGRPKAKNVSVDVVDNVAADLSELHTPTHTHTHIWGQLARATRHSHLFVCRARLLLLMPRTTALFEVKGEK